MHGLRHRFIRVGEMTGLAGLLKMMTLVPQPGWLGLVSEKPAWTEIGGFSIPIYILYVCIYIYICVYTYKCIYIYIDR